MIEKEEEKKIKPDPNKGKRAEVKKDLLGLLWKEKMLTISLYNKIAEYEEIAKTDYEEYEPLIKAIEQKVSEYEKLRTKTSKESKKSKYLDLANQTIERLKKDAKQFKEKSFDEQLTSFNRAMRLAKGVSCYRQYSF